MAHTVIPPPRGTTATLELAHKGNINDKTIPERDREGCIYRSLYGAFTDLYVDGICADDDALHVRIHEIRHVVHRLEESCVLPGTTCGNCVSNGPVFLLVHMCHMNMCAV